MADDNDEFSALLKSAEESQREMQKLQKKLFAMIVRTESADGDLTIDMTGMYAVTLVRIEDSLLKKDKAVIEESLLAVLNDAAKKIATTLSEAVASMPKIQMPKGYEE